MVPPESCVSKRRQAMWVTRRFGLGVHLFANTHSKWVILDRWLRTNNFGLRTAFVFSSKDTRKICLPGRYACVLGKLDAPGCVCVRMHVSNPVLSQRFAKTVSSRPANCELPKLRLCFVRSGTQDKAWHLADTE